jgi:hypothetical protein
MCIIVFLLAAYSALSGCSNQSKFQSFKNELVKECVDAMNGLPLSELELPAQMMKDNQRDLWRIAFAQMIEEDPVRFQDLSQSEKAELADALAEATWEVIARRMNPVEIKV